MNENRFSFFLKKSFFVNKILLKFEITFGNSVVKYSWLYFIDILF